ncbi:MAG TPA: GAD-like domain-containing protein [Cellvibrio sp.]|nr:GAD-like domain-containing protein [Cellvibrio sp.]
MRDRTLEHLALFEKRLGNIQDPMVISEETYKKYTGILPNALITMWKRYGWGSFADGAFWLVNPEDYEDLVSLWLEDTPYATIDQYHVIARTAFGNLYLWGQNNNQYFTACCAVHALVARDNKLRKKSETPDDDIGFFFSGAEKKDFDMKDENKKPLFLRALEKLGQLKPDEVYGFKQPLFAGGRLMLDNLEKVKLDPYLTILRQLGGVPNMPYSGITVDI